MRTEFTGVTRRQGDETHDRGFHLRPRAHAARPGQEGRLLHEVPSVRLAAKTLEAIRDRNGLDTTTVDDIIMGCVDPVMDAGAVIPKAAAFEAGYSTRAPGMQISRFCASGLDAVNFAAGKIAQGADDIVIAGGVESMSRVGLGMSGGAWFMDPSVNFPAYFMPQGVSADLIATKYGFSRTDVDAYAVESQKRAAMPGRRVGSTSRSSRSRTRTA
jgi:acetyl-CoA C-acetyltransferase